MDRIGLIAGNGELPVVCAQAAAKAGVEVVAVAVREETEKKLEDFVGKTYWIGAGELKTLFEILVKERLKQVIMVGQIRHRLLFSDIAFDAALETVLAQLKDKKTDTILGAIAAHIRKLGIEVIDSTTFLKEYLPPSGTLTAREPTPEQMQDIAFGRDIAKAVAGLDIGQTIAVKDKVVLAVEAIEGTDEAIRRASRYGRGNIVVVKVSKPCQDFRFDIPLIGKQTINILIQEKVAVLAIEAGKTFFLDKKEAIEQADKHNISIVAF